MRTRLLQITVVCFATIMVWGMPGCAGSQSQPTPAPVPTAVPTSEPQPTADPAAAVVQEMVARMNAEDYAGMEELLADDMMAYFIGMPPTGMEIYAGKEQFRAAMEASCIGQHLNWEVMPVRVEDGTVFAESKTWMDFTRDLGVAPNDWHEIFRVRDGKINLYVSTITEEALANFKPALYKAIPELAAIGEPLAQTDEAPVREIDLTIANGTCAYDGPLTLQAGELLVDVAVQDQKWEKYAVSFFTLDEGKDFVDLMASTYNPGPPSWSDTVFLKELGPGESQTYENFHVREGLLYMVCWAGPPDIAIGTAGPFIVKP